MNITFLIGNGFDLNVGLHTRYSDFYPYFTAHASNDNMIKKWLNDDILLWSDLEERLGKELHRVKEKELDKFYDDKVELEELLLEYLELEQQKIIKTGKEKFISDEVVRSMKEFYLNLSEAEKNSIRSTCTLYKEQLFSYCFLSFNYTNVLDDFLNISRKSHPIINSHKAVVGTREEKLGNVLHIHGTLNEEMILGVNDVEQIENDFLKADTEFLDTFIKKRMNESIGQRKTQQAKSMIENSSVICVFGMSLGNTDKMWWEELISWLKVDENNILIIYYRGYEDKLSKKIPANTIRLNNRLKREILEKGGVDVKTTFAERLKARIFISYNTNIFNFGDMTKSD